MTSRRFGTLAALALVAGLLGGCAGEPAPVETRPGFASEDEAFAAAEETYRAYVDALNARMSGSVDSDPEDWLVGAALDAELESQQELVSAGKSTDGKLQISSLSQASWEPAAATIHVCLDVSGTRVLNTKGEDITPSARAPAVPLEVIVMPFADEALIADINGYPEGVEC